jgi:hypothetical protein
VGRWISRDEEFYDGYNLYNGYFVPNATDPEGKFLVAFFAPLFAPLTAYTALAGSFSFLSIITSGIYIASEVMLPESTGVQLNHLNGIDPGVMAKNELGEIKKMGDKIVEKSTDRYKSSDKDYYQCVEFARDDSLLISSRRWVYWEVKEYRATKTPYDAISDPQWIGSVQQNIGRHLGHSAISITPNPYYRFINNGRVNSYILDTFRIPDSQIFRAASWRNNKAELYTWEEFHKKFPFPQTNPLE